MADDEPADQPAGRPAPLAAVSVKLPPFWPADPEVWFAQVEAQFTCRGITGRFDHVISSLNPEFAIEVHDLLLKPPDDHPYDVLKAQLIKRTAATEQRKLQQLISGEELGDRKPTQLLRRMQQLLGDKLGAAESSSFLRELFLQRLPANVQMVLASTDATMDLSKLAELADKEVAMPNIAAISSSHPDSPPTAEPFEVRQLREEVARLTQLVEFLTTRSRCRSPSQPRQRRTAPPTPSSPSDSLCWYHRKRTFNKLTLTAINNTPISTFGKRSLTLNIGLRRVFQWVFIIANVHKPMIGADFLCHFGLLVEMK